MLRHRDVSLFARILMSPDDLLGDVHRDFEFLNLKVVF